MKKWQSGLFFIGAAVFCLALNFLMYSVYYPVKYSKEISLASAEYSVEEPLIYAIVNAESSFDKNAVSFKGAKGLMQIMPSTAEAIAAALEEPFSEQYLFDPETNIRYGTYYLHILLTQFNLDEAICAYNAGPSKVRSWLRSEKYSSDGSCLDVIPYPETQEYLRKVKKNINYYKKNIKTLNYNN